MIELGLPARGAGGGRPLALFVGAHCDDVEIGCGGTMLWLRERLPGIELRWLILSSDEARRREALASARRFLGEGGEAAVRFAAFRDGFLPWQGAEVKELFERAKHELVPDLIFTHRLEDRHQDHRLVAELTWNTWRDQLILEYEVPKYEGDLGHPNVFVPLSPELLERKVKGVLESYPSQASRRWFDEDTLRGLARLRGVEAAAPGRFAEAFHARKLVLGAGGP